MVAVLFVRESICKHLSAVWVCDLVPYYVPRAWREAGALSVHPSQLERQSITARQNNYKKNEIVFHKLSTKSLVIKIDT
jgi:hypothetical protein